MSASNEVSIDGSQEEDDGIVGDGEFVVASALPDYDFLDDRTINVDLNSDVFFVTDESVSSYVDVDQTIDVHVDVQGNQASFNISVEAVGGNSTADVNVAALATDTYSSVTVTGHAAVGGANRRPTDISLSNAAIAENAPGGVIGYLAGTDPDNDTLSFSVVGPEATRFETIQDPLSGAWLLRLRPGTALDYEQADSVGVVIQASDGSLTYEKALTITVGDVNEAPQSISLAGQTVAENAPGATIGRLSVQDPDQGDTATLQVFKATSSGGLLIVDGQPVVDTRFMIDDSGDLKLAPGISLDHEVTPEIALVVRATDSGDLSRDEAFTISVASTNDAPVGTLAISSTMREDETPATRPLKASDITNTSTQFFNPANNHIYEFVNTDVRWDQALSLSSNHHLASVQGHLVTITSASEQAFIVSRMDLITVGWNKDEIWTAASDSQQEGKWIWMAGPEQGQTITFSDWAWPSGPADYSAGGDYGVLTVNPYYDTTGAWMDLDQEWFVGGSRTWENSSDFSRTYRGNGYVVEYSGQATETTQPSVQVLSVDTTAIVDEDGVGAFQYQWQRSSDGLTWNDISGATAQEYEVGSADKGMHVRAHASYRDGGGTTEHVYSASEYISAGGGAEEPPVDTKPDGLIELNGHYYQIVESHHISHADAASAVEEMGFTLGGVEYRGHLVTVTSSQEEGLIESAILGTNNGSYFASEPAAFWMGGEYANGEWHWTSGSENGNAVTFSDWGNSEALHGGSEPYIVLNMFARSDINGVWYSYDAGDTGLIRGYIVEYEAVA